MRQGRNRVAADAATPARPSANAQRVCEKQRQTRVSVPCPVASNAESVSAVATPLRPTVELDDRRVVEQIGVVFVAERVAVEVLERESYVVRTFDDLELPGPRHDVDVTHIGVRVGADIGGVRPGCGSGSPASKRWVAGVKAWASSWRLPGTSL